MKNPSTFKSYALLAVMMIATSLSAQAQDVPVRYVSIEKGNYSNGGRSWTDAKNNLQDAIEDLKTYMAANNLTEGHVYVSAGRYTPTTATPGGDGTLYTSFIIYEGIKVYGGFDPVNPEARPEDRVLENGQTVGSARGERWKMKHTTTLSGNHTNVTKDPLTWDAGRNEYAEAFTGNSYHVVWFASNGLDKETNRALPLNDSTIIDGFTVRDGYAYNRSTPATADGKKGYHAYHNSYGAGIYMVKGSTVRNCIITQNASSLRGGGVYMDGGGLLEQCHVTRNQSAGVGVTDGYGGGVAIDGAPDVSGAAPGYKGGMVRHCVIENNVSRAGAGVSLIFFKSPGEDYKLRYSSSIVGCVINNNTSTAEAGGVYLRNGGALNHVTIARNRCAGVSVAYGGRKYARSGGLHVDGGAIVMNSVLWGNEVAANNHVQFATYRDSAQMKKTTLAYVALSRNSYVDWSGSIKLTNGVYSLSDANSDTENEGTYPEFVSPNTTAGVLTADVKSDWTPRFFSYLRHKGMQVDDYPDGENIIHTKMHQDYVGDYFAPRCAIGALVAYDMDGAYAYGLTNLENDGKTVRTIFVDPEIVHNTSIDLNDKTGIGGSWERPFHNINDAIRYINNKLTGTNAASETQPIQIVVKQGTCTTAGNAYQEHLRTSTLTIPANVRMYGGFSADLMGTDISRRNPNETPTRLTANITGGDYKDNGTHIIILGYGASNVVVDGFQLYYANTQANKVLTTLGLEAGAGIAVLNGEKLSTGEPTDDMLDNTIRNCVVANCTAPQGAAIYMGNYPGRTMELKVENCIFHNNAVTRADNGIVVAEGTDTRLSLDHCLIRGNVGHAIVANNNAQVTVTNTAVHANIKYDENVTSNVKVADLHADESAADPSVVTFKTDGTGSITGSNNMMDIGIKDFTGVAESVLRYHSNFTNENPNFVNPTNNIGVNEEGDVTTYGGTPDWMPTNTNPMVNAAADGGMSDTDLTCHQTRNRGGAADIGALENTYQPEYGKVIYVRDYGNTTESGGDGSSWAKAINGNSLNDVYKNNHGFQGVDAELYAEGEQLTGLQWAVDRAFYLSLEKDKDENIVYRTVTGVTHFNPGNQSNVNYGRTTIDTSAVVPSKRVEVWVKQGEYLRRDGFFMRNSVDVLGGFPEEGNPGMKERNPKKYETIIETNKSDEVTDEGVTGSGQWGPQVYDFNDGENGTKPADTKITTRYTTQIIENSGSQSDYPVSNCIDNNSNSQWRPSSTSPAWIVIDLGREETITNLQMSYDYTREWNWDSWSYIYTYYNTKSYSVSYSLENKNKEDFTPVSISQSGDETQTVSFSSIKCRYLYITLTPSNNGIRLKELVIKNGNTTIENTRSVTVIIPNYYDYDLNGYAGAYKAKRVLTQPFPYFKGTKQINGKNSGENLEFDNKAFNPFRVETTWDGFTIQNGRVKIKHQRDGGAGVALRENGRLANCVIRNNVINTSTNIRGGGIFQNGGVIENCVIEGNIMVSGGGNAFGAGLYQRTGTVFNTSFAKNILKGSGTMQGTAVFFENGRFYNNTITENVGPYTVYSGKWFSNGRIDVYNTIICNNTITGETNQEEETKKNKQFNCTTAADKITLLNCLFDSESDHRAFDGTFTGVKKETFQYRGNTAIFDGSDPENPYRLLAGAQAINAGTEDLGLDITEKNPIELPSYDAEYTDRIKDCRVDIGAYEYNGAGSITPDISQTGYAIYYVTPYGLGDASANSPANAACWMKLQQVLDAAGRYTYDHRNDKAEDRRIAVVKLAGDSKKDRTIHKTDGTTETVKEYSGFTYRPTRSCQVISPSEEENQRDYSLMVPHGVQVWGGYPEDFKEENRDVLEYRTSFSGIFRYDDVDVEAYNVVTFTNNTYDADGEIEHKDGLKDITERAVLDGLFIENGKADGELAMNRAGGAAIVPAYGHIRNCIVQNNTAADKGGGLLLLPKALVSGSIIQYNSSNNKGGGLYIYDPKEDELENYEAPSEPMTWEDYAHIYTSDIIYNTANRGGGLYFTDNVRANSSLFWQNTGSEMANIAGQTAPTDVNEENHEPGIHDYPISFCATETTREPGINNIIVNTDPTKGVRFEKEAYNHDYTATDGTPVTVMHNEYEFYQLNKYSLIVRSGMQYDEYEKLLKDALMGGKDGLLRADMAGVNRADEAYDNEFIDIGARAYAGKVLPEVDDKLLMTRIFVGRNEDEMSMEAVNVMRNLPETEYYSQEGSSFAYPMRYLGDALEYIRAIRKIHTLTADNIKVYKHKNTKFEIILCGGTYYPRRNIKGEYVNGRGCTFLVPEGVTIVGGVKVRNNENEYTFYGNLNDNKDKTFSYGDLDITINQVPLDTIIKNRKLHDINHNNIAEPWEMENQTILSGQVVNAAASHNVFHIISCVADEDCVGGLPTPTFANYGDNAGNGTKPKERGVPVVIDGVNMEDGMALNYLATSVNSNYTYFKGGAICVEGNWTTGHRFLNHPEESEGNYNLVGFRNIPLEVRNCTFMNNGGGRGGAIFTDGELKVFACNFAQNYARSGSDTFDETDRETGVTTTKTMTYAGRGGAINASYETILVNSIFANNEADPSTTSQKFAGVGGAVLLSNYAKLHVLNCDFVRNKAAGYPAIFCYQTNKGVTPENKGNIEQIRKDNPHKIINSIFWGNESVDKNMDKVINFDGFEDGFEDDEIHPEALWFCAYEAGKGNTPVYSPNSIDYRLQNYRGYILKQDDETQEQYEIRKYTADPAYIPLLWNSKYNKLLEDNSTVVEVEENNPDVEDGIVPVTNNIIINSDNDAIDGPNFISPSNLAGKDGFYISADWMIGRINNLVDNGWTYLQQDLSGDNPTFKYKDPDNKKEIEGAGIYRAASHDFGRLSDERTAIAIGDDLYMSYNDSNKSPILRVSHDPNPTHHQTFIDLGVYEYQHVKLTPDISGEVDVLWVTEREKTGGAANGQTWATATSDLQRAIETLLASRNGHDKRINMLEGNYQPVYTINGNLAFTATTNLQTGIMLPADAEGKELGVRSLTIQGGYSKDLEDQLDVEQYPVQIYASERTGGDLNFNHVFVIDDMRQRTSVKSGTDIITTTEDFVVPVLIDGVNISNVKANNNEGGVALYYKKQTDDEGTPIASPTYWHKDDSNAFRDGIINTTSAGGNELYKLTLSRCSFFNNGPQMTGSTPQAVVIEEGAGQALVYNSLFHSNYGAPLQAADTKVVNCTFALNYKPLTLTGAKSELHNSILWRNHLTGEDILSSDDDNDLECPDGMTMTNNAISSLTARDEINKNVPLSTNNSDALQGPNFFNPDEGSAIFVPIAEPSKRDFHVNPSSKVLSKGSVDKYVELVKDKQGKYPFSGTTDNVELVKMDKDLAYVTRHYGSGLERGAYECVALMNRVLYVNPTKALHGSGETWEHSYGKGQLQTAIDAAAVYYDVNHDPENIEEERAFVFVKGDDESTGETITMREGVSLYGSIDLTSTAQVEKKEDNTYDDDAISDFITNRLPDQRTGLAMGSYMGSNTIVGGVKADDNITFGLFDGLQIGNADADETIPTRTEPVVSLGRGSHVALTNSIIAGNRVKDGVSLIDNNAGLLYDLLIRDNGRADILLGANAYALNCTFAGEAGSWTELKKAEESHSINNIIYQEGDARVPFAPYFRPSAELYHAGDVPNKDNRNLWYQLHERAPQIGTGNNGTGNNGKSLLPEALQPYVDFTADRDLLGNPRLLNGTVDLGCYETWATGAETLHANMKKDAENYMGHHYPHEGSVVYLHAGGNLVCDLNGNSPWFTAESTLKPGYLLAQDGGSLYGQGNEIRLHYVAAERNLSGQYALVAVPFTTPNDGLHITRPAYDAANGNTLTEQTADNNLYDYDAEARSQWNYEFQADNSTCWKALSADAILANDGFLVERSGAQQEIVRLTAYDKTNAPYQEGAGEKVVTLTQHDQSDVNTDNFHFTGEYNMGWNLKGIPYLISNYNSAELTDGRESMFVPHVVYTMDAEGSYQPAWSWDLKGADSNLSPAHAFFTQTAVIGDGKTENLRFSVVKFPEPSGIREEHVPALAISADGYGTDRVAILPATEAEEETHSVGSLDYCFGADGVKFAALSDTLPQIAVSGTNGVGLSLLSHATADVEIPLTVEVKGETAYTFSLTNKDAFAACDNVYIKDHATGAVTSLLTGDYTTPISPSDSPARFSLCLGENPEWSQVRAADGTYHVNGYRVKKADHKGVYIKVQNGKAKKILK